MAFDRIQTCMLWFGETPGGKNECSVFGYDSGSLPAGCAEYQTVPTADTNDHRRRPGPPGRPRHPRRRPGTTVAGQHSGAASAAVTTVTAATAPMPGISPPTKTRLLQ